MKFGVSYYLGTYDTKAEADLIYQAKIKELDVSTAGKRRDLHGSGNPAWKGGHQYWQKGKLGRDKDGLSWKRQRQLCRERDKYTCQDCGKGQEELGYTPHCDHEVPYRLSFSHALNNLRLRCRSCHKKAEASRTELWGGKTFGGLLKKE